VVASCNDKENEDYYSRWFYSVHRTKIPVFKIDLTFATGRLQIKSTFAPFQSFIFNCYEIFFNFCFALSPLFRHRDSTGSDDHERIGVLRPTKKSDAGHDETRSGIRPPRAFL
jgi:hypothetical protein